MQLEGYITKEITTVRVLKANGDSTEISIEIFARAIKRAHDIIDKFKGFEVDVFRILGMRNLSAFIGELYGAAILIEAKGLFHKNPHQDGYPDLLLMDAPGRQLWESLRVRNREKSPFSNFAGGGIEIKATCGSVPTPKACAKKGFEKPDIGDQRINCMMGYDWKAHHRESNNLLGIIWDFVDGVPRIVAVFYSANLRDSHWGAIVHPKVGGGRTTSVSIMSRLGILEMYEGWLFVLNDNSYIRFLDRVNGKSLLAEARK